MFFAHSNLSLWAFSLSGSETATFFFFVVAWLELCKISLDLASDIVIPPNFRVRIIYFLVNSLCKFVYTHSAPRILRRNGLVPLSMSYMFDQRIRLTTYMAKKRYPSELMGRLVYKEPRRLDSLQGLFCLRLLRIDI